MKTAHYLSLAMALLVLLAQCKKNDNSNNNTTCTSSIQLDSAGLTHVFIYDGQGRLIQDSIPGNPTATSYFNYAGQVVNMNGDSGAAFTITLNSAGLPVSLSGSRNGNSINCTATYNTDGTLKTVTDEGGYTYIVTYANGNVVQVNDSADGLTFVYDYYSNTLPVPYNPKAALFGLSKYFNALNLRSDGTPINPQPFSKNLIKSITLAVTARDTTYYNYQFDSKGKVTSVSETRNEEAYTVGFFVKSAAKSSYSYNCQ